MRYFILILLLVLFYGCSLPKNIVGKYMSKDGIYNLQIKKDSSFIYQYGNLHLFEHSEGKWKQDDDNHIRLYSNIPTTEVPMIINTARNENSNVNILSLNVSANKSINLSDYKCIIYINDGVFLSMRCDSLANIPIDFDIKSMKFGFVKEPEITTTYIPPPLKSKRYLIEKGKGNIFNITAMINDSHFYYRAFDGDSLKVKRNKLKLPKGISEMREIMQKIPDETNIFIKFSGMDTNK